MKHSVFWTHKSLPFRNSIPQTLIYSPPSICIHKDVITRHPKIRRKSALLALIVPIPCILPSISLESFQHFQWFWYWKNAQYTLKANEMKMDLENRLSFQWLTEECCLFWIFERGLTFSLVFYLKIVFFFLEIASSLN